MAKFLKLPKMIFFGKKMNFYIVGGLVLVLLLFSMGIFANKVQEGFKKKTAKKTANAQLSRKQLSANAQLSRKQLSAQLQRRQNSQPSPPNIILQAPNIQPTNKKSQQQKNAENRREKMKKRGEWEEREAQIKGKRDKHEAREAKRLAAQVNKYR